MFCSNWVIRKGQKNVLVKVVKINNCSCTKSRKKEDSSLYGDYKLFLNEDEFEVVRIDCGIANIPPFRIDILLSSESIWFDTKITRT